MGQYIDKSAVVAEIERTKVYAQTLGDNAINISMQQFYDGMVEACDNLLNVLDTLEVKAKEVDLEKKEVHYKPLDEDFERDAVSFCIDNGLNTTPYIAKTIAKHFYELGIQQSKGE